MKFYCVTSSFDDKGHTNAMITDCIESDQKPENTFKSTARKDIYSDWFDSIEEAKDHVISVKNC